MHRMHASWNRSSGRMRPAIALGVAAWLAAGCASASGGGAQAPAKSEAPRIERVASADSTPMIRVINDHADPMNVYLVGNGQSRFLGVVAIADTLETPVPENLLGATRQIEIQARALGGTRVIRSGAVYLHPGDVLEWTITP